MGPISSGLGEIYQFEVRGEPMCRRAEDTESCYTAMELRTILDWFVIPQLRAVPGIVEVNAFGGELKTWQVTVDPERCWPAAVDRHRVFEALEANNRNVGGGYIEHQGEQYLVRGEGLDRGADDLARSCSRTSRTGAGHVATSRASSSRR
jgi:cobalt-zinc-cadmium resistance protein CzcA